MITITITMVLVVVVVVGNSGFLKYLWFSQHKCLKIFLYLCDYYFFYTGYSVHLN